MTNHAFDALLRPHEGSERPFLHLPSGVVSHGAFQARAAALASVLAERGLRPGDRLAMQVSKGPDALALVGACLRAGVVFLPLNTAYTAAELSYFVSDAGARLLVCDAGREGALAEVAGEAGAELAPLEGLVAGASGAAEPAARGEHDLAALLYTSGTTGRPKGAMLTHGNLVSNALVLARAWRFEEADVLIHALPIFHTHGLFVATNVTLAAGGSMILMPRFDAGEGLDAMPRATALMGVPTFYTRLLAEPGLTAEAARGMRLFVSGSAPLPPETHAAFEARTGHRILERYGMTETNMIASNPYDGERRPGSVGFALPGVELRVVGPGREPLPAGEVGGVEVRGPNVFRGYWNRPDKTAEDLHEDGWFETGDLGRLSGDGRLSIVGRSKDLVISGGYNVYPKEVEEALDAQPGVLESAVIGAPHPDLGEGVVAVLVPRPGEAPDPEALDRALRGRLAGYKRPRRYELVPELPRNAMGKVQKNVLRERLRGAFASGDAIA